MSRERRSRPRLSVPKRFSRLGGSSVLPKSTFSGSCVATAAGKAVPPQTRYAIPRSMLSTGEANDIMVFDEHGFSPSKTRVVVDEA